MTKSDFLLLVESLGMWQGRTKAHARGRLWELEKGKETDPLPESPEETQPWTHLNVNPATLVSDL